MLAHRISWRRCFDFGQILRIPIITDLVLLCPIDQRVEVAAFVVDAKIRVRLIECVNICEGVEVSRAAALDILHQKVDAMANVEPGICFSCVFLRRRGWIFLEG